MRWCGRQFGGGAGPWPASAVLASDVRVRVRGTPVPSGSGPRGPLRAGDGNRTRTASLEGWSSAIELHPRAGRADGRERQSAVPGPGLRHPGRPGAGPVRGCRPGRPPGPGASGRRDSNPRPPAPKAGALPLRHSPQRQSAERTRATPAPCRDGGGGDRPGERAARWPWSGPVVGAVRDPRYTHAPVKTIVAPLEGNKVKLSVEVDEEEFDKAITAAYRKIAREVRIPGFRPGKAPRKVLEKRLGTQIGREQALNDALPEYYARAIIEHDVDAIDAPQIDITSGAEEGPVSFEAVVEVRPKVQVPGYEGLRVQIARPEVGDDEVDAQIDRMREVQATFADVDRPAQDGGAVVIDITGTLDGEAQDGLTADDYSYTVGSGAITPEVDEQLRGAKADDILEFAATHPDPDEQRELRFRVLVKQVREKVLPELDDEWVAENSEFETVEALRDSIRERALAVRKLQAQAALREAVGTELAK